MVHLIEYRDRLGLANGLAALVAGQLHDVLAQQGHATLAVPGGTTPGAFLRKLSGAAIDWQNVSVVLTDERFVPETSPRSNTRLLRETLLQGPAAAATLIPMHVNAARPEDVLEQLAKGVQAALPINICVLGMGEDMHIASLFPEADLLRQALDPATDKILLPMRAPMADEPRLTLTAAVLRNAQKTHILITGPNKKQALEQAEQPGPTAKAPVRAILSGPGKVTIHYAD